MANSVSIPIILQVGEGVTIEAANGLSVAEGQLRLEPILADVVSERDRQDQLFGEQNIDPFFSLTVLMEEVGEASNAAIEFKRGNSTSAHLREELVQTAAVAIAAIECLDRGTWVWGVDPNE